MFSGDGCERRAEALGYSHKGHAGGVCAKRYVAAIERGTAEEPKRRKRLFLALLAPRRAGVERGTAQEPKRHKRLFLALLAPFRFSAFKCRADPRGTAQAP